MASDCATMTSVNSSEVVLRMRSGSGDIAGSMKMRFDRPPQQRAARLEHPVVAGQPLELRPARRPVSGWPRAHDQAGLLDADHAALEQPRIEVVRDAGDDEIVARGEQFARQHAAGVDLHVDLDARVSLADPPDRRNGKLDRRRGDGAEKDRAALAGSSGRRSRGRPRAVSSSIARARRASAWPYGVSATPRGSRSQSGAASMSSISAIMREAAGCEMLSTCAAALTWP